MENWQVVLLTLLGVAVLFVLYAFVAGGSIGRFLQSRAIAARWLRDPAFAEKVEAVSAPPKIGKPSAEPLWLLAILQREGRLLDFLLEDIQATATSRSARPSATSTASAARRSTITLCSNRCSTRPKATRGRRRPASIRARSA